MGKKKQKTKSEKAEKELELEKTKKKQKSEKSDKKEKKKKHLKTEKNKVKNEIVITPKPTKEVVVSSSDEEITLLFKALADENRIQIIRLLKEKELCAAELLQELKIVQSTLSHHMKILTESGIISVRRDGKWSRYSINGESAKQMISFLEKWIEA